MDLFADLSFSDGPPVDVPFIPPPMNGTHADVLTGEVLSPMDSPPTTDGPTCVVCGVEVPYKGRGPKPKYCQDHKTTRTRGPARVRVEAVDEQTDQKRAQAVYDDLLGGAGELAGSIAPVMPVTAVTIGLQSPRALEALVRIGQHYPKFFAGLEKAGQLVPFVSVGKFICALALAVMVDFNQIQPYGVAGEYLGVAQAAQEAGWTPPDQRHAPQQTHMSTVDKKVPPPPQFKGF